MVARDENRNRNGHVLVWEQTDLAKEDRNIKPKRMYDFHKFLHLSFSDYHSFSLSTDELIKKTISVKRN